MTRKTLVYKSSDLQKNQCGYYIVYHNLNGIIKTLYVGVSKNLKSRASRFFGLNNNGSSCYERILINEINKQKIGYIFIEVITCLKDMNVMSAGENFLIETRKPMLNSRVGSYLSQNKTKEKGITEFMWCRKQYKKKANQ